jgi:hypothetical protein
MQLGKRVGAWPFAAGISFLWQYKQIVPSLEMR